jgi:hypothetical protein
MQPEENSRERKGNKFVKGEVALKALKFVSSVAEQSKRENSGERWDGGAIGQMEEILRSF